MLLLCDLARSPSPAGTSRAVVIHELFWNAQGEAGEALIPMVFLLGRLQTTRSVLVSTYC